MKHFIALIVLCAFNSNVFAEGIANSGGEHYDISAYNLPKDEILTYAEFPVTETEGNSRGLEGGFCRVTLQRIKGKIALTVAFNSKKGTSPAISSVMFKSWPFPMRDQDVVRDDFGRLTNLFYHPGEMILSDQEELETKAEAKNYYLATDPSLKKVRSVRVRFFEDVKRKGRNETGSVLCNMALS